MDKKIVYLALTIGGLVGSYLPVILLHSDSFGAVSILTGLLGSLLALFVAYKLTS